MSFIPSENGLKFPNRFLSLPFPKFICRLLVLSRVLDAKHDSTVMHGLCGGICFVALDYFYATKIIPHLDTAPTPGTRFYKYLLKRQNDTYGRFYFHVFRFVHYSCLSDRILCQKNLLEFKKIANLLEEKPLALGIIYIHISQTRAIWSNHQVIATRFQDLGNYYRIRIYDPNHPGSNNEVIDAEKTTNGLQCIQKSLDTGESRIVRGFFLIPYSFVEPPSIYFLDD
jgi:hypothetical protein